MKTLAFECSAKAASAALMEDGKLLGMYYQNSGLTHSKTLLPMAEDLLKNSGLSLDDVDVYAVSAGPGSFTGVRIGVSTVKGLCWGKDRPCVGVSTLEAMAWNAVGAAEGCLICCCMDARRSQVYNALFEIRENRPQRLSEDRAISLEELSAEVVSDGRKCFVLGDGAELFSSYLSGKGISHILAPQQIRMQNAWGVCLASQGRQPVTGQELLPVYLRLSQAERERLERIHQANKQ